MPPHTAAQTPLHNYAHAGVIRLCAFARNKGKLAGIPGVLLLKDTVSHHLRNQACDIHW